MADKMRPKYDRATGTYDGEDIPADIQEIVVERREEVGRVTVSRGGSGPGPFEAAMTLLGKHLDSPKGMPVGEFRFEYGGITVNVDAAEEGAA